MFRSLLALFILFQAGATRSLPATDVKAADIQATVEREKSTNTTDIPIRTVDAGGHNVGIAVVHRGKGTNLMAAAVHDKISEVYQVLEGSGTFVTGGSPVQSRTVAPGETRAREIVGGQARQLVKGDIIVIPSRVPHWFKEVRGPLLYYVVKVSK